jgi:hypothetical protein
MPELRAGARLAAIVAAGLIVAGCQGFGGSSWFGSDSPPPPPPPSAAPRPSIFSADIVGRWGIASYHRDTDRQRTEAAAAGQCRQPYIISSSGAGGGVMMLNHDSPNIIEHQIKASVDGKTYIGPGSQPGAQDDREVLSFDGRVLILRWVDQEVAGRYGTMVLVRCGAEGTTPPAAGRPPARSSRAPAPQPR